MNAPSNIQQIARSTAGDLGRGSVPDDDGGSAVHGGPGAGSRLDPFRTRRFFLAGVAVGVIAMSAAGLAAARLIESPSQLAARTAAPATSVITGVAKLRMLRDAIMLPGLIRPARTTVVRAAA